MERTDEHALVIYRVETVPYPMYAIGSHVGAGEARMLIVPQKRYRPQRQPLGQQPRALLPRGHTRSVQGKYTSP